MRTYSDLTPNQRQRFSDYISRNRYVPSRELAEDLTLRVTTVAAVKANLDRVLTRAFNRILS